MVSSNDLPSEDFGSQIRAKDQDCGIGWCTTANLSLTELVTQMGQSKTAQLWFVSEAPGSFSDLGCNWWVARKGLKQIC